MTLHQLEWAIFDIDPQVGSFIEKIKKQLSAETNVETSVVITTKRGGRLNTKLRQQTTVQEISVGANDSFWDRNFQSDDEVAWYKFQKCFLDDYESQLSGTYGIANLAHRCKIP